MTGTHPSQVVLGVSDSLGGLQALRFAVAECRRRGAVLRAVRAWRFTAPWSGEDIAACRVSAAEQASNEVVAAFDQALGGMPADVVVDIVTMEGEVVSVLTAQRLRDDDLLVVGAATIHRMARLTTVDGQCGRIAPCPVVAVPPPALARQQKVGALAQQLVREVELAARRSVSEGPASSAR